MTITAEKQGLQSLPGTPRRKRRGRKPNPETKLQQFTAGLRPWILHTIKSVSEATDRSYNEVLNHILEVGIMHMMEKTEEMARQEELAKQAETMIKKQRVALK